MRTQVYKILLISLFVLGGITSAECRQMPDSLVQYLGIAARNNPSVLQRFYEYQAALEKVPQVGGLPDPELTLGVFISPMELVEGRQVADIRLMQMFPWFGTLRASKDEMSLMAGAKYNSFLDAKLQVFYDLQRSWYELQKIRQDIKVSEQNLEILNVLERLSMIRFQSPSSTGGRAPSSSVSMPGTNTQNTSTGSTGMQNMGKNSESNAQVPSQSSTAMQNTQMAMPATSSGLPDIYRIQIEIGDLQNRIALLKSQQATAIARFNSYLDRKPESIVSLPDSLTADTLKVSLIAFTDSMLNNNPMLGMLQFEQQSLDARKKMVTKMGYPMLGLGLDYMVINKSSMSTSSMNGKDMIMPMLTATLPIYRKKYKAMKNEADLLKTAAEQDYKATANSLQTEYYQALELYQDAGRRINLYRDQSELSQKSLDIMIKDYSASGLSLTDILQVRRQLLDYEFKQVEAVADNNTAIAWLSRLAAISYNQ